MTREHIHFVTGRLAEFSLRNVLKDLADSASFDYSIEVLKISVAALMTPKWVAPKLQVPSQATRVMLPGYCRGDLKPVAEAIGIPVECGPRDLRQLPRYFQQHDGVENYGPYDIEIIAEINHAPSITLDELLAEAKRLQDDGADLIDLGCNPGETWPAVGEAVYALRNAGHRISIDSMNSAEIESAVKAGAELVLSVNSSNRDAAADWSCEVVAIPDDPHTLAGLDETVERLTANGVPYRIDPVLEPIGFGFAQSLGRYLEIRRHYPDAEMMMGIGNLTELTDADSAPINVLLMGFCQELGIRSVLTTQVINWARTSVRECDLARRLVHYAVQNKALPKHVEPGLTILRDQEIFRHGPEIIERLAREIKDNNFRIFAEDGRIHALSAGQHCAHDDPFELFEQLLTNSQHPIDASHAFYLGYEMAKAATALALGKQYRQDEALDWGLLTVEEKSHRKKDKG